MLWWLLACSGADLAVVSAREDGVLPRSAAIQGRDGGSSALAFGRTVWTYGDTVLDVTDSTGTNWHTNSYDVGDPATWRDGLETPVDEGGAARFIVPLTDEERAWDEVHAAEDCAEDPCHARWQLWPSQPLVDPETGRAWILYGKYNVAFPSGIAVAAWDGLDRPVVRRDGLLFGDREREWANAPVVHDERLYAFGCERRGLDFHCAVARVPIGAVDDRAAWRFWDGDAWSVDATSAVDLFLGAPIMSVAWAPALDRWLLVYSEPFSRDVRARTATALTGPWSRPTTLFTVDGDAPYDVVHHAELAEDDGAVQWITYSRPTGEGWFGAEHVRWRVELMRLEGR